MILLAWFPLRPPRPLVLLFVSACMAPCALAQSYPAKLVRVVLPSPPGSAADIVTRAVTTRLAERTGQQFVVDARAGASGIIAAEIVSKSVADGYTLLVPSSASHGINVSLYRKLPCDAVRHEAGMKRYGTAFSRSSRRCVSLRRPISQFLS